MSHSIYIPSIDAKDLYLSNNFLRQVPYGYKLTKKDGSDNFQKYINTFDYSLDLIELKKVAKKIYKSHTIAGSDSPRWSDSKLTRRIWRIL